MTETASGKIQETQISRYKSTRGLDYDSVPWRLYEKSKELFWNPSDIDFTKDAQDWKQMTDDQRRMIAGSARGFMVGEEAVTLDILPLFRAIADEGRLEETMYLSFFTMEEAKHTDFFRRWFDAVEFDPRLLDAAVAQEAGYDAGGTNGESSSGDGYGAAGSGNGSGNGSANGQPQRRGVFDGDLTRVMRRLDNDRSPERFLDASLLYNHLIEAIAAINGYKNWNRMFAELGGDKLPGLQEGLGLIQRDERRHIAYGTYLCRRILAEHPHLWEFVERRWAKMTAPIGGTDGGMSGLAARRLEVLRVAVGLKTDDVEYGSVEELEPEEV